MKKSLILICAALLLVGSAAWAQGDRPGYGGTYSSYDGHDRYLTPDQHRKLADLKARYEAEITRIDRQIAQKKLELNRLSKVPYRNRGAIDRVRKDIARLQDKRAYATADYQKNMQQILSAGRPWNNRYAQDGPGTNPHDGWDGYDRGRDSHR
jgi:hypothetical protein